MIIGKRDTKRILLTLIAALLGLSFGYLIAHTLHDDALRRRAEEERRIYCIVWQHERIQQCLEGRLQ